MTTDCPNGFLKYGFIIYGKGLDPFVPTVVSKGFAVECPDRANASDQFNIDFHAQLRRLLQMLGGQYRMQLCWSVDSNYRDELAEYGQETRDRCHAAYPRQIRTATFLKFHDAMERRELRREHLHLYVSKKISATAPIFTNSRHQYSFYDKLFAEYQREFHHFQNQVTNLFASSNVRLTPLGDRDHFRQGYYYLNPPFGSGKGGEQLPAFDPDAPLQELWLGSGLKTGNEHLPSFGFKRQDLFWNLLTIRRLPDGTDPKSILLLTQTELLDYSITVNLYPSDKEKVVAREQEKLRRVRGDYASTQAPEFLEAMAMIEERIKSLKRGSVNPYDADFIIRIWATTPEEVADKTQILRTVINRLDGCREHEPLTFSTNKQLWFQSWPGWLFGKYTHHAKYFEDINLASMLPFSSTFTGHLHGAEILHAGANRSVVGIKTNIEGQPQHCLFLGMTGAGKTTLLETFLGQGHHRYAYTFIVEEGFGYSPFAKALGYRPKVIRPDGEDTLNYLDTGGLPLTKAQKSEAAALCAYMVGASADEDRQRMRLALFARYIDQLYTDTFEDWSRSRPTELLRIAREALEVTRWQQGMETGTSFLEAWIDAHQAVNASRWEERLHAATEVEVTQFLKTPTTEQTVRDCVFAHFKPEEMPTHSVLVEMMRRIPMPEHDRRTVQDLAEQLADWSRDEGSKGKLFDGVTNISLTDEITLIELSLLGSGESPLKTAAYYLVSNACRKHIMTLPRHVLKRGLIEEAARVAEIPNGAAMMEEMAAQLRKYNCWACFAFQNDAQLEKEKVRKVVFGNIKQALLGRQRSPKLVASIAHELELPEAATESIARYPLPEHIGYAYSQFLYYHMDAHRPLCGTITVTKNPPPEAKETALAAPVAVSA
jgi:hypothetical protein